MAAVARSRGRWAALIIPMALVASACTSGGAGSDHPSATPAATAAPVVSAKPGEMLSPTPFDMNATPVPGTAGHGAPSLEALLPDAIGGRPVTKESGTGVDAGKTDADPLLKAFGKLPTDYEEATGTLMQTGDRPGGSFGVYGLRGVPGDQVLAFWLAQMPDATVSKVALGGHQVTYVEYGAWPSWMYASGDLVYAVGLAGEATAAEFFAALP
jgi:hypothetical protein